MNDKHIPNNTNIHLEMSAGLKPKTYQMPHIMSKKKTYRIFEHISDVDISEQDILEYDPDILSILLIDRTMTLKAQQESNSATEVRNIFWATDDYEGIVLEDDGTPLNDGYRYNDQIMPENITGKCRRIIMPRVLKDRQAQIERTKDKAEVFTPSWVCNAQNNLVDSAWFGYKNVFNTEVTLPDGTHSWTVKDGKVLFPEEDSNKTWKKYITDNRLEVTCGEAPYLVSRYDTTTGNPIPIRNRIGLLDRKLRVICENAETKAEWLEMARKAYMHTYGYEWQGDNLLLARESLLYTFIEYYIHHFNDKDSNGNIILKDIPLNKSIKAIAEIISWNIWQMDGIKMVIPGSCDHVYTEDIWGDQTKQECPGCLKGDLKEHIGTYCIIRDWGIKRPTNYGENPNNTENYPWQHVPFYTLVK